VLISKKKNKNKPYKFVPNKVSVLPTTIVNSNNSNSNGGNAGNNNAVNAGGTVVNNSWVGVQMYFPWYAPPKPVEEKKATVPSDGRDGLDCKVCKEFYQYAESNQEDGTLICFKCRNGY
jgi:hypothetical protein